MPRFYCALPLGFQAGIGQDLELPAGAARHVQVLRLQPGGSITLFDGLGGEYTAEITQMGRSNVAVRITSHEPTEREATPHVALALGVPANERMDWLVEKATELGVASIQPLMTERGVLRLAGERAIKKQAHWQAIAIAACEQCGRNRVPKIEPVKTVNEWLAESQAAHPVRLILSLQADSKALREVLSNNVTQNVCILSGAEGGLSPAEEAKATAAGFQAITLGNRVLRAETAALAALVTVQNLN